MELTIIIPVYNVENHLSRCLDSIFVGNNIDVEFEVIAVDDGSTDNSYGILQEYTFRYKQLKIYHQENQGSSVARNKALDVATGKYIMFVDSDDFVEKDSINTILQEAIKTDVDILFYDFNVISEDGVKNTASCPNFQENIFFTGEEYILRGSEISSPWKSLYRRKLINDLKLRFYPGIIHQDTEFLLRLFPFVRRIIYKKNVVYNYYNIGESATRTKSIEKEKKIVYSDFVIVTTIKAACKNIPSKKIVEKYTKQMNSLLVSSIIILFRNNKKFDSDFKKTCINYTKTKGCYPIKGRTLSWKTTALIPIINQEWLLRILLK